MQGLGTTTCRWCDKQRETARLTPGADLMWSVQQNVPWQHRLSHGGRIVLLLFVARVRVGLFFLTLSR